MWKYVDKTFRVNHPYTWKIAKYLINSAVCIKIFVTLVEMSQFACVIVVCAALCG